MRSPDQDEIKVIRYHSGLVQDNDSGVFYNSLCNGRLIPVEQYEHDSAVWAKFKCQLCGKWVNVKLHGWK